jgi:predicted Fe-S protein YdhL (DUF1289 family)
VDEWMVEHAAMRDLDEVFDNLSRSAFRRRFGLNARDSAYLQSHGLAAVMKHARDFIARRLAPAAPEKDGKQTPYRGHPVFVAQHATATCCRGCLEKWHGITRGHQLTREEQARVLAALERWLRGQDPGAARN